MSVVKSGEGHRVVSKDGKVLSKPFKTFKEAAGRLRQIEHFANRDKERVKTSRSATK